MFKKLGALLLTGALCAALTLPALAAEMTFPLDKSGKKVTLSDVVSTEKKTVPFWEYSSDGGRKQVQKEITIHHLATDCVVTFISCEVQGIISYVMSEGAYVDHGGGQSNEKFVLNGNPGDLVELIENFPDTESVFCMPAPPIATAAPQTVLVDGKEVKFDAFALKDENGNMTNYFKARDVASVLSGKAAQFNVSWTDRVLLTSKTAYTPNGTEMTTPFTGDQPYAVGGDGIEVNGGFYPVDYIVLTDAKGGGHTYYKLRELGEMLGFKVDWNGKNVTIDASVALPAYGT